MIKEPANGTKQIKEQVRNICLAILKKRIYTNAHYQSLKGILRMSWGYTNFLELKRLMLKF